VIKFDDSVLRSYQANQSDRDSDAVLVVIAMSLSSSRFDREPNLNHGNMATMS